MATATIPMVERPQLSELDLFAQLVARVVEVENSARDDARYANQEIRELRESIDSLNKRMDTFSAMLNSHDHRIGVAETMAKDASASAAYVENLVDGMTEPAKTILLPPKESATLVLGSSDVAPDVVPRSLDPNEFITVAEFIELEGLPGRRSLTPKGISRVLHPSTQILRIWTRSSPDHITMFPVFLLRSFARFLQSPENEGDRYGVNFTRWAMEEDKEGKLRGEG